MCVLLYALYGLYAFYALYAWYASYIMLVCIRCMCCMRCMGLYALYAREYTQEKRCYDLSSSASRNIMAAFDEILCALCCCQHELSHDRRDRLIDSRKA